MRVEGSGFRAEGCGLRVEGQHLVFRVQGSGFRVQDGGAHQGGGAEGLMQHAEGILVERVCCRLRELLLRNLHANHARVMNLPAPTRSNTVLDRVNSFKSAFKGDLYS